MGQIVRVSVVGMCILTLSAHYLAQPNESTLGRRWPARSD